MCNKATKSISYQPKTLIQQILFSKHKFKIKSVYLKNNSTETQSLGSPDNIFTNGTRLCMDCIAYSVWLDSKLPREGH